MKSTLLLLLFIVGFIYPQADTTFSFDLFTVRLSQNTLQVFNPADQELFRKNYNNPTAYTSDLDGDGIDELLLSDYLERGEKIDYILYVYSTIDSFSESAVIYSGYLEPYISFSDEVQKNIIVSGDSSLNFLNNDSEIFYPLIIREFEDGEVLIINNEIYDLFIQENDAILDYLVNYYKNNEMNCSSGIKIKNAISAGYINYISAGELTMAENLLNSFYPCSDSSELKQQLDNIINKDQ